LRPYLDAALEGDDVAVTALVRMTQAEVWRVCRALGSAGEVDDLVQETYLRALGAMPRFRGEAPVRLWLLSIARRVCADHVRRRQRRRRLDERLARLPPPAHAVGPDVVDDLLAALAPERHEAFVLTQLVGLSYEEAAAVAGCPVGTIRSRVARARADLTAAVSAAAS
jgi:RNA polymerase sigma-70 factor (ECF subfamily)